MNTMDLQSSIHNLSQMDRHQDEAHRVPAGDREQNAQIEREQAARRPEQANEPEQPEGKNVDSESRKRYQRELERRKRQKKRVRRGKVDGAGRFVDVTV